MHYRGADIAHLKKKSELKNNYFSGDTFISFQMLYRVCITRYLSEPEEKEVGFLGASWVGYETI